MFIGEYLTQIGEKNRLLVPKKLRDVMKGQVYLTRGYEGCLLMVDSERWRDLLNQINQKSLLSLDVRDTKRYIIGGAFDIEIDSQGRFVVPEGLVNFGKLKDRVVFLGVGEWIEIWDEAKWLKKLDYLSENVTDLADRISEKK